MLSGCESLNLAMGAANYDRVYDTYAQTDTTETSITNRRHADGRDAGLISAFFGLDDALPEGITDRVACEGAGGADGMPIIFSHEVDIATLEPGDLRITTQSGAVNPVTCLTLDPASDPGELRTALLAGFYGSAEDEPVSVDIVGNVLSLDGTVNFKGASVAVTPLEAGPTLVWAEIVPEMQWDLGGKATDFPWGGGSRCPVGTAQVVRVTWGGGVTKPGGDPADDTERKLYKVKTVTADGKPAEITPFALADLKDGDNNHLLCLDTTDAVTSVFFPAGYLTDPREDLNPDTTISLLP
ncbi:hypothetical protein GCM10011342_09300 [Aquisalinus flavus]|uniref:Uncharacterized protein n=1 Tax=Aquisalinus flavus TaxID=1526572 RepID=A0A8J2V4J3_9PROT|nr:hypothetical protein GCM10011342_09300 [Aquisalinus flavus]